MSPNELIDFMLQMEKAVEDEDAVGDPIGPTGRVARDMLARWNVPNE